MKQGKIPVVEVTGLLRWFSFKNIPDGQKMYLGKVWASEDVEMLRYDWTAETGKMPNQMEWTVTFNFYRN